MNRNSGSFREILALATGVAAFGLAIPAQSQTALTSAESSGIINGPCASTRAIAAAVDFSIVGLSWPNKAAKFEAELPMDLTVEDLKGRIAQSEENIRLYYDDFAGKLDDYQLCLRKNKLAVALSRPPSPAPMGAAPVQYPSPQPTGAAPAPYPSPQPGQQTFVALSPGLTIERRERAYDAVSTALQAALGGDLSGISSGSKLLDRVMASLATSLQSGGGQDLLGANGGLLDSLLGEVRNALGTNLPSNANQLADLALGELKRALNKPRTAPQMPVAAAASAATNLAVGQAGSQRRLNVAGLPGIFAEIGESISLVEMLSNGALFRQKDNNFDIYANGCTNGEACSSVSIQGCFVVDFASLGTVNAWNRDKLYARAYLDSQNRLCIDDVVFAPGSAVDVKYLGLSVEKYRSIIGDLKGNFGSP